MSRVEKYEKNSSAGFCFTNKEKLMSLTMRLLILIIKAIYITLFKNHPAVCLILNRFYLLKNRTIQKVISFNFPGIHLTG